MNGLDTLEFLGLTEDDRTLEYRSFGWNSAQVLSLLPFLQKGLTMHIAKRFSHSRFFEWVQNYGITFSAGVPTVLNMLLNKPLGFTAKDVPTLRLMSCSTAPLTAQQWLQFEEMYGVTLLQMYGMSETGWICGNRHYAKKMGTVGLPALHQELKIVDGDGNECRPASRARSPSAARRWRSAICSTTARSTRCSASASRPATSASRTPKASSASPAAART